MSELTESRYLQLADQTFRRIEDALEPLDPDDVDYERAGDVLTITFANGVKCIVNTQRPTRQIWVAARANAWHLSWEESKGTWFDDKDSSIELMALLARVVKENAGLALSIG